MTIDVHVDVQGHSKIDFDKRKIRKVLRTEGRAVQKAARRLVARKAISNPGEFPGKDRGFLQRAIGLVFPRSKDGYWVKVEPTTAGMKKSGRLYYPAILYFGSAKRGIAPRGNYMVAALDARRDATRAALAAGLQDALIPKP
jgi:hypothetical protein